MPAYGNAIYLMNLRYCSCFVVRMLSIYVVSVVIRCFAIDEITLLELKEGWVHSAPMS